MADTPREIDNSVLKVFEALAAVDADHKRSREWSGKIACPACGGALHWSKAKSNGHVHGLCETQGCLAWMM